MSIVSTMRRGTLRERDGSDVRRASENLVSVSIDWDLAGRAWCLGSAGWEGVLFALPS